MSLDPTIASRQPVLPGATSTFTESLHPPTPDLPHLTPERKFFSELLSQAGNRTAEGDLALSAVADIIRLYSLYLCRFKGNHVGSCFSLADIVATIYTRKLICYSDAPHSLTDPSKSDPLVLSVGHAVSSLYAMYTLMGQVDAKMLLMTRTRGGLPGHPESRITPDLVFLSSGSLGQGLADAVGAAAALPNRKVFVIVGDGETQEGNIQEAIAFAGHKARENLIAIVDCNKIQLSGAVDKNSVNPQVLSQLFHLWGWRVIPVHGHEFSSIEDGFQQAFSHTGSPCVILADTLMGKGVSFMESAALEGKATYHHGRGALGDSNFHAAEQELLFHINRVLDALGPNLKEQFQKFRIHAEQFSAPPIQLKEEPGGHNTQDAFAGALCKLVQDGVPIAYLVGDLTGSGSIGAARVKQAIEQRKAADPDYRGMFVDVGIREQCAATMMKGIARASQIQDSSGNTISQEIVPVFSCYAAMISLISEPMHMAHRDELQFIVNAAQFGLLYASGGNSHNTSVPPLSQFLPAFIPSTEHEAEAIVEQSVNMIRRGKPGKCCIASARFKVTPSMLGPDIFLDAETIAAVNQQVEAEWRDHHPYIEGAYRLGQKRPNADATIVTSGPMVYFAERARRFLEREGLTIDVVNVIKYSRQYTFELARSLGELLPDRGSVFTIWDGDRAVLFERVSAAVVSSGKTALSIHPLGPMEESDANGTLIEAMEAFALRTEDIIREIKQGFRAH